MKRAATTYADGCESAAPERLCVASSDVVLTTAVSPPEVSVKPEPISGYCGDGLFSTEEGCNQLLAGAQLSLPQRPAFGASSTSKVERRLP